MNGWRCVLYSWKEREGCQAVCVCVCACSHKDIFKDITVACKILSKLIINTMSWASDYLISTFLIYPSSSSNCFLLTQHVLLISSSPLRGVLTGLLLLCVIKVVFVDEGHIDWSELDASSLAASSHLVNQWIHTKLVSTGLTQCGTAIFKEREKTRGHQWY